MYCLDPSAPAPGEATANEKEWTVEEIAAMTTAMENETDADTAGTSASASESASQVAAKTGMAADHATPPKRPLSGLYKGAAGTFQLELRVDVDGKRPTRRVSGDLYRVAGSTTTYFGSFIVNSPTITVTGNRVTIKGSGNYSFITLFPIVTVTITRVPAFAPAGPAKVTFSDAAGGQGTTYHCSFVSPFFRTVQYEQDVEIGTKAFEKYNTGSQTSGGPSRVLSVVSAYNEAGIDMQIAGVSNIVTGGSGQDRKWSDAELHASMVQQFSMWRNDPQWKVWLLVANDHERQDLRGIMFDQQGKQRQGCAVFYDRIKGDDNASQRAALRTYVHELGHCFNLLHSWQKSFAVPPQPNRIDALSWMNYVQNFPGGANAYWSAFPFQFDDPELVHLRHGFRNNVIMGGNSFAIGAADFDTQPFNEQVVDNSGLKLELRVQEGKNFVQGEPVVVELKLSTTDLRGKRVHTRLHPNFGFVQLAIQMPSGNVLPFRPLVEQCLETETTILNSDNPSIYASAYIGYGKGGFYFDQSGIYQMRAIYHALDGSEVVSNILTVRVRNPLDKAEEAIADAYSGHDQGTLFFLLGSDSEYLDSGNKALDNVMDRYSDHPLSVYAKLVKGINAGRAFKTVTEDKMVVQRAPNTSEAIKSLTEVIEASTKKDGKAEGLDNITLNMAMRKLARAQSREGDLEKADRTLEYLVTYFKDQLHLKPHVVNQIATKTAELRQEVHEERRS
jgi:hypothetical protein